MTCVCQVYNVARGGQGAGSGLFELEHLGFELVTFQELVELGAIALRKFRSLGDVASGHAEDANQILTLEGAARRLERGERHRQLLERRLRQGGRDQTSGTPC